MNRAYTKRDSTEKIRRDRDKNLIRKKKKHISHGISWSGGILKVWDVFPEEQGIWAQHQALKPLAPAPRRDELPKYLAKIKSIIRYYYK